MELQDNSFLDFRRVLLSLVLLHGISFISVYSASVSEIVQQRNNTHHSLLPPLMVPSNAAQSNETVINVSSKVKANSGNNGPGKLSNLRNTSETNNKNTTPKPAHREPIESDFDEVAENLKEEVEEIQVDTEEDIGLEEQFHKQPSSNLQANPEFAEDIETKTDSFHGGHIAVIFAGVVTLLAIAIYVGLITWRSYLEKRYGMREQLVTEDDYYNNNDIRNFTL